MSPPGRLRIAGGELGGRLLKAPPGRGTRPTSARVREAVFAVLGPLAGVAVLDLFAGSGAMGFEALSRGASSATFVERDRAAAAVVRANADALGVAERCRVVAADYREALRREGRRGGLYGLCLIDPPYSVTDRIDPASVDLLLGVLESEATVVVESAATSPPALAGLPAATRDDRVYGDTAVSVIRLERTS